MFARKAPSKTYPLVIPEKELCATVVVEKSMIPDVYNKENIHGSNSKVKNNFKQSGSGWQAAEKMTSYTKEQEMKTQLEAKSADIRGSRAMAEEWWKSQRKIEDQVDVMKNRKYALEVEKERSANIISLPKSTFAEVHTTGKLKSPHKLGEKWPYTSSCNSEKYTASQEMNACERAALISEMQKKNTQQQLALEAKRNEEVQNRFQTALNKHRLEMEYSAILKKLERVEKQYQHQNAQKASEVPSDRITMCAPVDKIIKSNKQDRLGKGFRKVLPKPKEHAIEDLVGYKDELEEIFTVKQPAEKASSEKHFHPQLKNKRSSFNFDSLLRAESFEERYYQSREKSTDDIPPDILNMAYIELSSPDELSPLTSSPISSIKHVKRDVGVQVDDSMFPVSRGVQVNLLPTEIRYEHSISDSFVDDVDHRKRLVSVGIQTDYVIIIDPTAMSSSSMSTTSYHSVPSKHGVPLLPSLFKARSELRNAIAASKGEDSERCTLSSVSKEVVPETGRLCQIIKKSLTKHKKYFPPLSDSSNSSPESREQFQRLQKNITPYVPQENADSTPKADSTTLSEPAFQAIPLSEPIRDPLVSAGSSSMSTSVAEVVDTAAAKPLPFIDNIGALNQIRRQIYAQLNNKTASCSPSVEDNAPPSTQDPISARKDTSEITASKESQHAKDGSVSPNLFPAFPINAGNEPANVSQSYIDIRKEELPSISMLANLSEVEISRDSDLGESKDPVSTSNDSVPDWQTVNMETPNTRSAMNIQNLQMIANIIHRQMQNLHPSLEISSLGYPDDSTNSRKFLPRFGWLRNGEPFVYHELSIIQEADSALADITAKSNDEDKSESSSFQLLLEQARKNARDDIDSTPTSLITDLSDVSHMLDTIKILPQSSDTANLAPYQRERSQQKEAKQAFLDMHSPSESTGSEELMTRPLPGEFSDRYSIKLRHDSSTSSYPRSLTIPSDSPSSSESFPTAIKASSLTHQGISSKSVDPKSEWEDRTSEKSSPASPLFSISPGLNVPSYPEEYRKIVDALIRDYGLPPPPMFPLPNIARTNDAKPALKTDLQSENNRCPISDISQISLDLNQGDLTLLTSNSSSPSTKSTCLPEYASGSEKDLIHFDEPPVSMLSPQREIKSSRESTPGSFKPLSLLLSSFDSPNSIAQDHSESIGSSLPYVLPTLPTQRMIPISSFSPLSHFVDTESDSPKLETLKYDSAVIPESARLSEDVDDDLSPTLIDQGASTSCQGGAEPDSTLQLDVAPPGATQHSPNINVPLWNVTDTTPYFQALTLHRTSSLDPSYTTQLKDTDIKVDSDKTLTPSAIPLGTTKSLQIVPQLPLISLPGSDSGSSFRPLTLLDTPSSGLSSPAGTKPGSTSSSQPSESYKTVLHKAVTRVSEDLRSSDYGSVQRRLHLGVPESSSSSDESLSRMFTRSKIAHQSTPSKKTDDCPQGNSKIDEKDDENLLAKSKSINPFDSIEHARYYLTSNASKLMTQDVSENVTTQVETLVKTELVSVTIQNNPDECHSSEAKMSQSMISFLQHEVSLLASPSDHHVSLISEDFLTPSTQEVNKNDGRTPRIPLIIVEPNAESCTTSTSSWSTPTYSSSTSKTRSMTVEKLSTATPSQFTTPTYSSSSRNTPRSAPGSSLACKVSPWANSEYKKRTKRLWNNLEEVKAKQQVELKKKALAQNKEKVKELQMKLRKKRTIPTPKKK